MRKITLFFFLLLSVFSFAQSVPNNVKYFVGSGTSTAYFVVDFKDGTDDRSYVWGVRFDGNNPITGIQMLDLLTAEEPNFSFEQSGGFLDQIAFNAHDSYNQPYDFWSLWSSSDGANWIMDGWMSAHLSDGEWYGATYGFGTNVPGPDAPITPIPAYSSQWLSHANITNWIGTGTNESLVVIDFGTTTNTIEDSFVFGIKYNGTLTAQQALDAIQANYGSFSYVLQANALNGITIGSHTISNTEATLYKGTDLSNWVTQSDLNTISLNNKDWLGISFADRRPFNPQDGNAFLFTKTYDAIQYNVYPNPSSNFINIQVEDEIQNISIYSLTGAKVLSTSNKEINISHLSKGTYILKVATNKGIGVKKIMKN